MEKIIQKKNGYCDYMACHEGVIDFDCVDYCPRHLTGDEIMLLLDKLSEDCFSFGQKLKDFISENPDLDWRSYFYGYSRDLSSALSNANNRLRLKYTEETLV